jgi:hypothetical protein
MFLSEKKLIKITGYKYAKWQAKWLFENKLPYTWNSKGALNVLVSDYIKKFGLKDVRAKSKEQEPEFEAIRDINGKTAKKASALTAKGAI